MRPRDNAEAPPADGEKARWRRPLIVTFALVAGGAVLVAGTWALATSFRSPAQVAADASPPPRSIITVEVAEGILAEQVTAQAIVGSSEEITVPLAAGEGVAVVTNSSVTAGQGIGAGGLLLELNNAPVFAMPGSFPLFRDLRPGDSGRDVAQLQQGLRDAGYAVTVDGALGRQTVDAVRALYAKAGYEMPVEAASSAPESGAPPTPAPGTPPAQPAAPTPVVKASAFAVAGTMPTTVIAVPPLGALAEDAGIVFSSGDAVAVSSVVPAVAAQLEVGYAASATLDGAPVELTLTSLGETDEEGNTPVVFASEVPGGLRGAIGTEIVVVVTRDVIAEDALLVPSIGVVARGERRYVLVEQDDGSFDEVAVRELGVLNGTSAVEPVSPESIASGDRIRVNG